MEDKLKSALMFLGGVAVGTMVGVLLAPESGEKTRKRLGKQFDDLKDDLEGQWTSSKSKLQGLKDEALAEAERLSKKISKTTE
ncbi:YtxH domain-containing protein [Peijinzhouia sedimentorum]